MTDFLLPIAEFISNIFIQFLTMSLSASLIVGIVFILRLLLKKSPKWITVLLWAVVAVRLICPFTPESSLSLIPESISNGDFVAQWTDEYIKPVSVFTEDEVWYDAAVTNGREPISDGNGGHYVVTNYDQLGEPYTVKNTVIPVLSILWIAGMITLLIYTVISYVKLRKKIDTAVLLRDNIYQSENVISPFVLGIIKPKIYLPFNMSEDSIQNVIAHEQAHIKRKDYLWKPLGFLILTVYWFNPVMWLAYVLLCRDIELACDEKVVKDFDNEQKADYSEALLSCSVNRRIIAACPLAFGEVGVKNRVKSVLNYKKPAFWVIVVAIVASIVTAVCFLTNPKDNANKNEIIDGNYQISDEVYCNGSFSYIPNHEKERIEIEYNGGMHIYHFVGEELSVGGLYTEAKPNEENFESFVWDTNGWIDYKNTEEFLKDNKKAWYHPTMDTITTYPYMLFSQKDGTLYIAFADSENGESTMVRCIHKLNYIAKEYYNPGSYLSVKVDSYKGTTQLPDETETLIFDIHNGTSSELPNGTGFEITECNLQEGSLTLQLTGEKLYSSMESDEVVREITVYENEKGIELTDDNYENDLYFITFSFIKNETIGRNLENMLNNIFLWLDIEFLYCDKYQAIHYSTEDETETPGINIGEVYGEDLVEYLNSRKWKKCSAPWSELSSPGSVEFVISDKCHITVYQKKNIFSRAYAVVTENDKKTYYKAEADDYVYARDILKAPDLTGDYT